MAVATLEDFLDLVRKSGLVECERLDSLLQELRAAGNYPSEPAKLAEQLVQRSVLTSFQAEQLLAGRWKGFFISKYKILQRLGSGGMGMVFLAEHKYMKRLVALKVLPRSRSGESSALERFYREAKAIAALDHPNVVRAYDLDQEGDLHFLVMEYVDGVSLQELVKAHGPFDVERAVHYLYQAAKGLQHAYSVGLIHRDIKPANLLVNRAGLVKLLDLGLARFFQDEQDILTRKYDEKVLGTADYLAPEQAIDSHVVDIRADIYSLGATFYYVLAGHPPFPEGTVAQKLIWHQTKMPKPIREMRGDVPEQVADLLQRMLGKKPQDRPQTPEEVARTLEPLVDLRRLIPPPGVEPMSGALGGPASTDHLLATLSSTGSGASSRRLVSKTEAGTGVLTAPQPSGPISSSKSPLTGEQPQSAPAVAADQPKSSVEPAGAAKAAAVASAPLVKSRQGKPLGAENKATGPQTSLREQLSNSWRVWCVVGLGLACGVALAWWLLRWLGQ
ncbi:Serine/threonine-protein kinase PrkC [bacterium HR36]|nr:Serine/threonine-protein kinase PrkC [bacterium HR36]